MPSVRRTRKADQCLAPAEGDRADWRGQCCGRWVKTPATVAVRKDDVSAADHAAMANVAGLRSISGYGGLIQTTELSTDFYLIAGKGIGVYKSGCA